MFVFLCCTCNTVSAKQFVVPFVVPIIRLLKDRLELI